MKEFNHVFECTRVRNDTLAGDESINIHTPYSIGYITRDDVIEMAKYFGLELQSLLEPTPNQPRKRS